MSKYQNGEITRILKELAVEEDMKHNHRNIILKQVEKLEKYTDRMNRIDQELILHRPFPKEQIKHRKGFNGSQLAYVETVNYIERLNEAFGLKWNWQITDFAIEEKQVYCKGKLTVTIDEEVITKEGFGGKIRNGGELGDDLKSASSDALKVASKLFGIGLDLYKSGNNGRTPVASRQ